MEATIGAGTGPLTPVSRPAEVALLRTFLRGAADAGGALLVSGEPGAGKTLLLDMAAEMAAASGTAVLRGRGVRSEADVGFGALNQVLLPLVPYCPLLAETHRRALRVPLGLDDGPPPDQLLVSAAALELLRHASRASAVLIVIDDLPLLDRQSACVLSFVSRRVSGSRIGFLAASRGGEDSFFDGSGLPEHELTPLAEAAAEELLVSRFPGLAAQVRARVLAEARGNPLALLELPAALSDPQRAGSVPLPSALPLTRRLRALFSPRVAELPGAARRLLLLAALDGTGDPRVLAADRGSPSGTEVLGTAKRAGLLYLDEARHRLAFGHPLVRSSVIEQASDDERRAAHRELAALFGDDPDRHAWYLAAAAREPDERIASQLEHAAKRSLRKGDAADAVAALTRAAKLSPASAERGRRLAHAATIGVGVAGERQSATALLTELRRDGDPGDSLEAAIATSYLLISRAGDIDSAHRLLTGAIETRTRAQDEDALEVALYGLMLVCFFGGRAELWQPFHQAISRLSPGISDTLRVCDETCANPVSATGQTLKRLSAAIDGLARETDPIRIIRVAFAATFVDRLGGCHLALRRVINDGRTGGAVVSAILALNMLGVDNFQTGRWDMAAERAAESARLCEDHDYVLLAWPARYVQAALAAVRGDYARTRALTDEMQGWAAPRQLRSIQRYAWQARSLAAIGSGDFEEAYRCVTQISPAGQLPSHTPHALRVAVDLVESCMRTNRQAEAAAHVAAMEAADIGAISPRLRLAVTGCAAIAASDVEAAVDRFSAALAIPGIERWPFELARIQLLYGERLRRAGATRESRVQLNDALEKFQWLGARPWTARALDELRATGQTRARGAASGSKRLTAREHQIATLAAGGLRNREIAAQLFVSERTVAAHLHRVFPKLGVTTRAGLRDALASVSQDADPVAH
jgi:DNA-binding CsgD family transcriptional regulator